MKMKKLVCILILICVIIGVAFAQAKPAAPAPAPAPAKSAAASSDKANAIGLDLYQLIKGLNSTDKDNKFTSHIIFVGYERLISPHFSIGAALEMYFCSQERPSPLSTVDSNYFSIAAEGRYYPSSENLEKFFIGAALGFCQYEVDGKKKWADGGFSGLCTSVKIGYKLMFKNGIFLEPSMAYLEQNHRTVTTWKNSLSTPYDWNAGLRLGYAF
jgi:hypothetical protein